MGNTVPIPVKPAERAVSLVLEAEVIADADTGRLTLIASTDHHMSDLDDVSPARLRKLISEARAKLDEFERLANEYEAIDTLRAILAEHGVEMEEWDTASLDPKLRRSFAAFAMLHKDGSRLVVVPKGQDPIERLAAVAELIRDIEHAA